MEPSFFELITDQAGTMLLALIMIWIMKAWHEDSVKRSEQRAAAQKQEHELDLARIEQHTDEIRDDKEMLAAIVRANTESNMKLIAVVERLETVIRDRVGFVVPKEEKK